MSKRIIIDPITRIEGHLRIEVEVDTDNRITDVWSSATLGWSACMALLARSCFRVRGIIADRIIIVRPITVSPKLPNR